jgi:K+-transporting ATPase ATPase A chain
VTANGLLQVALYFAVLTALAVPLGRYMAAVYEGRAGIADRVLGPLERLLYRLAGVDPSDEMSWRRYAGALLFNAVGFGGLRARVSRPGCRSTRRAARRRRRRRAQYGRQLRHQHQLAGVRR